ncbi:MPN338 family protein [Mycoplasma bradburyae]|uniref:Uncharacterized protein n=1 Tax=Mycoplasma bradburyae TaxID=2963128 RepID=A0AAW6HNL3_9MOLU|nr:hypothetical protein [Mycoplasma bradburyae]MDC4163653.1 hypothetical protein [Mycoplasma bradburyae]MDC4182261.1 hypothetical protein [Mycoplasma bradburyae]MDC4182754.1 hypothetical protein [Mycoplasma bradburyae]MDC4183427.1 hypothetical protein [Mycoplasma bradburyae]MDC4184435.1 hypothetical protein [Mycoplasma bradburyae]
MNSINKELEKLSISTTYPFYIDNVNIKFFNSLQQHPNKYFVNKILPKIKSQLDQEELDKLKELDDLTRKDRIKLMLNLALKKIVSKTGSADYDFFKIINYDQFHEPLYISEKETAINELVHGNFHERRYNYYIDVNKNSYLYQYAHRINLWFYLNEENKILSGSFSFELVNLDDQMLDSDAIYEKIYLVSLVKYFIYKQLYPLSLNNLIDIIDNDDFLSNFDKKNTKEHQNNLNKNIYKKSLSYEVLKSNWDNLITEKFLKHKDYDQNKINQLKDDLFYAVMNLTMINLALYQELKSYFNSENPELILSILKNPTQIKSDPDQRPFNDFIELSRYLKQEYLKKNSNKIEWNKIDDFNDLIDEVSKQQAAQDYEAFNTSINFLELKVKNEDTFISSSDLLMKNPNLFLIYSLIINPHRFGLNSNTTQIISYNDLMKNLKNTHISDGSRNKIIYDINQSEVEINKSYISFINSSSDFIVIKKHEQPLIDLYIWAIIYSESRKWIHHDIEYDFNNNRIAKNSNFYRQKIESLENLKFDWYDDFYGIPSIKTIVKKIDQVSNIKSSIDILVSTIKQKDALLKKDFERKTMVIAYVVALFIGFINFFGMIFTILAVTKPEDGLNTTNIIVISIASLLITSLIIIISFFLFRLSKNKK